ncbi:MAG TPA: DNA-3-methyladenine glycosylase [Candidatus Babeliales bacterium]|nr:DNA-3-methyladenine glycosylase [Candidatus Babeliales bacterium]
MVTIYKPIARAFYKRNTVVVARELMGAYLVRKIAGKLLVGKIVETEAYPSNDPASHAFIGERKRNRSLFGRIGHAYVYFVHNNSCLNIVARDETVPAGGVLIRAIEPVSGIEYMKKRRPHIDNEVNLTNGPGKLTKALGISRDLDGLDLSSEGELFIAHGTPVLKREVKATRRIGISKGVSKRWRFILKNNRLVSKKTVD